MADEKTEISEGFVKLHELVDGINVNISYLKANVLDAKESKRVIRQFSELDDLIIALQSELSEIKKKYLEPEHPEQGEKRWNSDSAFRA